MRNLLLVLLVAAVLPVQCWAGEIVIELEDSRIRAGDLEEITGPSADPGLDLGPAPAPGVRRRVTRVQLERWARTSGASTENLPGEVVLMRKMRRWSEGEAIETLMSLLAEETSGEAEIELPGFSELNVPAGELEWELLGRPRFSARPARLSLRWRDPGGRSGVEAVTAAVRVRVPALIALRDLPAGAEIQPGDTELGTVDLQTASDSYLTHFKPDGRLVLTSSLKTGEPLSETVLDERPEVERGAIVELTVAMGAIRLRASARAEGSGSTGDLAPFRNLETNQRVLARVTGANSAEVVTR